VTPPDRPGGPWSRTEPDTSDLEEVPSEMFSTVPHTYPAPPDPDGTPTMHSLPIGLGTDRVNRSPASVDSAPAVRSEVPVNEKPGDNDPLPSAEESLDRLVEIAEDVVVWLVRGAFVIGGGAALIAFGGMVVLCLILLFRGA
jgi:hypothetical protein